MPEEPVQRDKQILYHTVCTARQTNPVPYSLYGTGFVCLAVQALLSVWYRICLSRCTGSSGMVISRCYSSEAFGYSPLTSSYTCCSGVARPQFLGEHIDINKLLLINIYFNRDLYYVTVRNILVTSYT